MWNTGAGQEFEDYLVLLGNHSDIGPKTTSKYSQHHWGGCHMWYKYIYLLGIFSGTSDRNSVETILSKKRIYWFLGILGV